MIKIRSQAQRAANHSCNIAKPTICTDDEFFTQVGFSVLAFLTFFEKFTDYWYRRMGPPLTLPPPTGLYQLKKEISGNYYFFLQPVNYLAIIMDIKDNKDGTLFLRVCRRIMCTILSVVCGCLMSQNLVTQ